MVLHKLKIYSLMCLISIGSFACGSEDKDTSEAGAETQGGEAVGTEAQAGDSAGIEAQAGEAAGAEARAGEAAGTEAQAGEEVGAETPAGEEGVAGGVVEGDEESAGENSAGEDSAGEDSAGEDSAGDEVIIEVSGEQAEEWVDPEDFGAPGEGIHAFTMVDINGEEVDMRRYRDRVVLAVNVASRCGFTRQYEGLQTLYDAYRERGLVILGFPANNFGGQEPGTDEEIAEFCSANYGVNFPLFSKISVKGDDIHPLYSYLTEQSGQEVSWNFNKFLVGTDGLYIQQFLSPADPMGPEITAALDQLLPE